VKNAGWTLQQADSPVLIHVPHASVRIPDDVRAGIVLDDAQLADELGAMTDHATDRIALAAAELVSANVFVNEWSRLVIDPERFPDEREVMGRVGMGAVYTGRHYAPRTRQPSSTSSPPTFIPIPRR
jgi:N-formylglutamate deformylase